MAGLNFGLNFSPCGNVGALNNFPEEVGKIFRATTLVVANLLQFQEKWLIILPLYKLGTYFG